MKVLIGSNNFLRESFIEQVKSSYGSFNLHVIEADAYKIRTFYDFPFLSNDEKDNVIGDFRRVFKKEFPKTSQETQFCAMLVLAQLANYYDLVVIRLPEFALHDKTVRYISALFAGIDNILVTTESPEFIRSVKPEDIVVFNDDNNIIVVPAPEVDIVTKEYDLGYLWTWSF